nr:Fe(3+)-hydroxamate ABC transporter permease FhuB [Tritonibacter litoralis]
MALLVAALALHLVVNDALSVRPLALLSTPGLEEVLFLTATLPRITMALLVGAAMGLSGALLQEISQNRLVAPTTLGTASGAWLAMVATASLAPAIFADQKFWVAMSGAIIATGLVLVVSGRQQMASLSLIIVGMCANLVFGGLGMALVFLDTEATKPLFIWYSGDLTQTGWDQVRWFAPQLALAAFITPLAARAIALMRLGGDQARSRGLWVFPLIALSVTLASWMTAAAITCVGIIAFVGVLAPNMVRALGVRGVLPTLLLSAWAGAICLLAVDSLPIALSNWSKELIPSGSAAALLGAPAFILIAMHKSTSLQIEAAPFLPVRRRAWKVNLLFVLAIAILLSCGALFVVRTAEGLVTDFSGGLRFDFRWPRVLSAAGGGIAMATAGTIMQRLLRNPLASPDIVGVTSGATLSVVTAVILLGLPFSHAVLPAAVFGGVAVAAILVAMNHHSRSGPGLMILFGLATSATLDAVMNFVLARGGDVGYNLLPWLSGTTAMQSGSEALSLVVIAVVGLGLATVSARVLDLVSLGSHVAEARGVSMRVASPIFLILSAALAAATTAFVGPISFVGLLAPHIARMLGARMALSHLLLSAAIGALIMILSDHLGRILLFPQTLPSGTIATIGGGLFLFYLLAKKDKFHNRT